MMTTIVTENLDGASFYPSGVTVNSVTPSVSCITGTYRVSPAPVAQVTASITVNFAFSGLFTLAGQSLTTVTTTVTDQSRIYGI